MKIIKKLAFATLAALAVALLLQTPITRAGDHGQRGDRGQRGDDDERGDHDQRIHVTFHKCLTAPGIFEGAVDGDCGPGTVVFKGLGVPVGTSVVHFAGEYTVTTADCSFKAVCGGIRIVSTGLIVLNGVVTEGPHIGDQVHLRAQFLLINGIPCSEGTLTITPSED